MLRTEIRPIAAAPIARCRSAHSCGECPLPHRGRSYANAHCARARRARSFHQWNNLTHLVAARMRGNGRFAFAIRAIHAMTRRRENLHACSDATPSLRARMRCDCECGRCCCGSTPAPRCKHIAARYRRIDATVRRGQLKASTPHGTDAARDRATGPMRAADRRCIKYAAKSGNSVATLCAGRFRSQYANLLEMT